MKDNEIHLFMKKNSLLLFKIKKIYVHKKHVTAFYAYTIKNDKLILKYFYLIINKDLNENVI